ncbi:MAG: hypothetical protein KDK78_11630, partial [Chlamydiia bacterium]|nr:hypothetical protein [Chlamydiia bacterium]
MTAVDLTSTKLWEECPSSYLYYDYDNKNLILDGDDSICGCLGPFYHHWVTQDRTYNLLQIAGVHEYKGWRYCPTIDRVRVLTEANIRELESGSSATLEKIQHIASNLLYLNFWLNKELESEGLCFNKWKDLFNRIGNLSDSLGKKPAPSVEDSWLREWDDWAPVSEPVQEAPVQKTFVTIKDWVGSKEQFVSLVQTLYDNPELRGLEIQQNGLEYRIGKGGLDVMR